MCDVCKTTAGPFFKRMIHLYKSENIVLSLCYVHDLELFKSGQFKFLQNHKSELITVMDKIPNNSLFSSGRS
jgi:hypothetical protein